MATHKMIWASAGGYYAIPNSLARGKIDELNGTERHTIMSMLSWCNDLGKCFPSYETIANAIGKSRATAIRVMKSLIEKGFVSKEERKKESVHGKISDTSNMYTINLFKLGLKSDGDRTDKIEKSEKSEKSESATKPSELGEFNNATRGVSSCNSKEESVNKSDDDDTCVEDILKTHLEKSELPEDNKNAIQNRILALIGTGKKIVNLPNYIKKAVQVEIENLKSGSNTSSQCSNSRSSMGQSRGNGNGYKGGKSNNYGKTKFHNFTQRDVSEDEINALWGISTSNKSSKSGKDTSNTSGTNEITEEMLKNAGW